MKRGNSHRTGTRLCSGLLAVVMILGVMLGVMPVDALSLEEMVGNSAAQPGDQYELVEVPLGTPNGSAVSGNEEDGYVLESIGGNNMVVFDVWVTAMEFTADMELLEGATAAGLLFDVESIAYFGTNWSALHVQPDRNETARVFCEANWNQDGGLNTPNLPLTPGSTSSKMSLKITISIDNELKAYVNDMDTPVYTATLKNYNGGHVGLCTYSTKAKFTNIKLKTLDYPELDTLELIGGVLTEEFDPAKYEYKATVPVGTDTVKVKAAMDGGIIKVNGTPVASGEESEPITLMLGDNVIEVLASTTDGLVGKSYKITVNKPYDTNNPYSEDFRPQFHYSQRQYWVNDPNGMVYNAYTGEYHLYYQYNPGVTYHDGASHWGHAVSKDLVTWTELPTALYPDDIGVIASGSCVIDRNNTSGLFDESVPPESRMVAIYSYFSSGPNPGPGGSQRQAIAWSEDNGLTWNKYAGNSVIPNFNNEYGGDFRDPKVMWMEDTQQWLMVVAGGRARLFTSPDLINWTHNNDLFFDNGGELNSECPDLFPLTVDGTGETKWVYSGGGIFYVVGDLVYQNGKYNFVADTNDMNMYRGGYGGGYGGYMYATQTFSNMPDGRVVGISWMPDFASETLREKGYEKIWAGSFSLPMEFGLKLVNGQPRLTSYPVEEINSLRGDIIYSGTNMEVMAGGTNILDGKQGALLDIEGIFTPGPGVTEFGFKLRQNDDQSSEIIAKYDMSTKMLRIDTKTAEVLSVGSGVFGMRMEPLENGKVKLRILVDSSIIDLIGNDGLASTHTYFYTGDGTGMEFYTVGGNVTVDSLTIWEMGSGMAKAEIVPVVPLLTDLKLSEGELSTAFHPQTNTYTVTVPNNVDHVDITTVFAWATSVSGTLNGQEITMDKTGKGDITTVPLRVGENTVTICLKDRVSENTYTLTITRKASEDPVSTTLSGLEISEGTLDPSFNPDVTDYSAAVGNTITSITIRPTYIGDTAVTINGVEVSSGTDSMEIPLEVGENVITIAAGEKTYTITVTKAQAAEGIIPDTGDASAVLETLAALVLSTGIAVIAVRKRDDEQIKSK